ncbi:unnamed protein product [Peniophora sp. CBMAI 1063]|nr:unnamed protein product [Peniophora sp. CBMAI 1063]
MAMSEIIMPILPGINGPAHTSQTPTEHLPDDDGSLAVQASQSHFTAGLPSLNMINGANVDSAHPGAPGESEVLKIVAYVDGAAPFARDSSARPVGYGAYWAHGRPEGVPGDLSRRCAQGRAGNYAEMLSIVRVLELTAEDPRPLTIVTDSQYCCKCFDWADGWRRRGWTTSQGDPVKNMDLTRYMVALRALRAGPTDVYHSPAFGGSLRGLPGSRVGSERADELAVAGARLSEEEAEGETDEDWARLRDEAEARLAARG